MFGGPIHVGRVPDPDVHDVESPPSTLDSANTRPLEGMNGQSFDWFLRSRKNPAREITTDETDGDPDERVEQQVNVSVFLN